MALPNPFPQYQVVGLLDSPDEVKSRTVVTPEIASARKFVEDYCNGFPRTNSSKKPTSTRRPVCISIAGDYGTGKTHLLLDAIATLREMVGAQSTVIRLVAPEDVPSAWFSARPNPFLAVPMEALTTRVYSECGAAVAERAMLTEADASRIRSDPKFLSQLIRESKINASLVDEEFRTQLREICGSNVSADVSNAFAALASNITSEEAKSWLTGEQISADDRTSMRIEHSAPGDAELFGILVAFAAIHNRLNLPFALVIDELEHFADFDRSKSEKRNLTWLKRLLEALVPYLPLVMVSGHRSAWDVEANLIERFPERIRMVILSPEAVSVIVQAIVHRPVDNFGDIAVAIQEATGGKIRDVLTLCSKLWDETSGFTTRADPSQIRGLAAVEATRAIDEVQGLLQERGYAVRRPGVLCDKIQFDLVGSRAGDAEIVFDFRHQVTQEMPRAGIERFLHKVAAVNVTYPKLLACMVAEGNTDRDLTAIAQSTIASRVRYFDSKTHDMLAQIRHALDELGTAEPAPAPSSAEAILTQARMIDRRLAEATKDNNEPLLNQLREQRLALDRELDALRDSVDARNSEFEKRLKALEAERHKQYEEIRERAIAAADDDTGVRGEEIADAIAPRADTIETTYADIIAEYSPRRSLRIALARKSFLFGIGIVLVGLAVMFVVGDIVPSPSGGYSTRLEYETAMVAANRLRLVFRGLAFAGMVGGMYWLVLQFLAAQRYLEHARRLLRELYIRTARAEDLTVADSLLQELLARAGPLSGMLHAREYLAGTFESFDTSRAHLSK